MAGGSRENSTPKIELDTGAKRKGSPSSEDQENSHSSHNAGWSIFGYLIAGMAFYGGLGWLIGQWTHLAAIFPIGMLAGLGVGVLGVIYRYGRQ